MKHRALLATVLAALVAATSLDAAAQQKLLPAQSELAFTARQMGVPVSGHFRKFDAQVNFDASKLATNRVDLTVDMGSATLGSAEMDSELPKAPWFNVPKFPQARFSSSNIRALGGGKFEMTGQLSIKGQSHAIQVPVTMTQSGAISVATGVLPIKRLAFKVGDGDWADTSMVADDVQVSFKFALSGVAKL